VVTVETGDEDHHNTEFFLRQIAHVAFGVRKQIITRGRSEIAIVAMINLLLSNVSLGGIKF